MRVSFWLIPAQPWRSELGVLINRLAEKFNGPRFAPHVTLYSGPLDDNDDVPAVLSRSAVICSPLELSVQGVMASDQFTKTLFIQFADSVPLRELATGLRQQLRSPVDYGLDPHLSLAYANLTSDVAARLAREISTSSCIRFDAIDAIVSGDRTETQADVEAWRRVGAHQLRSAG